MAGTESLLTSAPGSTLSYDPLMRLQALSGGINLKRLHDGGELIAEGAEGEFAVAALAGADPGLVLDMNGTDTRGRIIDSPERPVQTRRAGGYGRHIAY